MKRLTQCIAIIVLYIGFAAPAYPWGSATHAYINARLGDKGILQKDVIYGGMAADAFNFMFDSPEQMQYLYAMTHGFTALGLDTVMPVLQAATTKREIATAFGFLSHNNINGADLTAHGFPYGSLDGYVIAKALLLNDILKPLLAQAGISIPDAVLLEVSHTFVEYAADWLIRKSDPAIGVRMILAAITRDLAYPHLLANVYAQGLADTFGLSNEQAVTAIVNEEAKFRKLMLRYGTILLYGDQKSLDKMAQFLTELAPGFLKPYGIEIPQAVLLPLTQFGITQALDLCKDDLMPKVQETIELVKFNLGDCRDGDC